MHPLRSILTRGIQALEDGIAKFWEHVFSSQRSSSCNCWVEICGNGPLQGAAGDDMG